MFSQFMILQRVWIVILLIAKMYQIVATLTLNRVQFVQRHVVLAKVIFKIIFNFLFDAKIHLAVTYLDSLQPFLVACKRQGDTGTKVVKKTSVLTQVAIGFIVLVTLIVLIVVLIKTYKKQKGKYELEKRLQEQTNPSVDTTSITVTPNCSSVN